MKRKKSATGKTRNRYRLPVSVVLAFFVMGFVDLVGIAVNYLQVDFLLSDTTANLFASLVFLWFLLLSVPAGLLMNRIGCRRTVRLSVAVTAVALLLPCLRYDLRTMLVSFALLGIGNTWIQVSLNPWVAGLVRPDRLAGSLTLGQFVKALASLAGPVAAGWMALKFGNWRYVYPVFFLIASIAFVSFSGDVVGGNPEEKQPASFRRCLSLLGDRTILLLFLGILCHVGTDVGINTTVPKILTERTGVVLAEAGYASGVYFLFRMAGCLSGAWFLTRYSVRYVFLTGLAGLSAGLLGLAFFRESGLLYVSIALVGIGNSNIFSILLSKAVLHRPERKNEVSGLMMMGLAGGALFPVLMGLAADGTGTQVGAVGVLGVVTVYLWLAGFRMH